MVAVFIESTGDVVDRCEYTVEHGDRQTPPEIPQTERNAGDYKVDQHQHAIAHVHHDVERIQLMNFRIVYSEPVAEGHANCQISRDNVQEPVQSLGGLQLEAARIETGYLLQSPSLRHEDTADQRLGEAQ